MADNKTPFAAVVDLETTGLDANLDVPLELGIKIINKYGDVLGEKQWLIWENTNDFQAGVSRGLANPFVKPMHDDSGLWSDLDAIPQHELIKTSRLVVDGEAAGFILKYAPERTLPMMGNSIGSLDRPFTLRHLPKVNKALSYRNIDVSSIRLICEALNPELQEGISHALDTEIGADSGHRVAGDIDYCIRQYQHYADSFFFVEEG